MSDSGVNEDATEERLIKYCADPPHDHILGGAPYGNKVIKISPRGAIKSGFGVIEAEAINQSKVHELVDPKVVRVPKVHRYFADSEGRGYSVMNFMDGNVIEPLETVQHVTKIAHILDHLASFRRDIPGPLHFGPPSGLLFLDEAEYAFDGVEDLEQWWNRRLFPGGPMMCLHYVELVPLSLGCGSAKHPVERW